MQFWWNYRPPWHQLLQMGLGERRRRNTHVGDGYGFPDSPLRHRSPAEACGSRHLRLHPCSRLLLRGHHRLVLASPPVEHTERLDSLHIRRSASHLLLSESNLYARRESAGTNTSVQLLLLLHQKQRLRSDRKWVETCRQLHLRNRLRRLRTQVRRREDDSLPALQPSQSGRTCMEERGTGTHEQHLPKAWCKGDRRRNTLRAYHAWLSVHTLCQHQRGLPRQLRGIEFSIKVLQYRRPADCQHYLSWRIIAPPHRPSHQHQRGLRCQSIWRDSPPGSL